MSVQCNAFAPKEGCTKSSWLVPSVTAPTLQWQIWVMLEQNTIIWLHLFGFSPLLQSHIGEKIQQLPDIGSVCKGGVGVCNQINGSPIDQYICKASSCTGNYHTFNWRNNIFHEKYNFPYKSIFPQKQSQSNWTFTQHLLKLKRKTARLGTWVRSAS